MSGKSDTVLHEMASNYAAYTTVDMDSEVSKQLCDRLHLL
jgi:hypothetical protein